jgi:hypothetical protein
MLTILLAYTSTVEAAQAHTTCDIVPKHGLAAEAAA